MAPKKSGEKSKAVRSSTAAHSRGGQQLTDLEQRIVKQLQLYAKKLVAQEPGSHRERRRADLREESFVEKLVKKAPGPLSTDCLSAIFRELSSGIAASLQPTRVAYLGPPHSYSHQATTKHFGQSADLVPVGTIASVFEEVNAGHVDFGVVPIENSTDGRIVDTLEILSRASVRICGEIPFPVHHNLLGNGSREQIKEVCSKPQALSQCRNWIANHLPNAKTRPMPSTTAAAKKAVKNPSVAAIASHQAGVEYGLNVLAKNIEDNIDNVTRFAVIGKAPADRTGNDKTSLMFELSHEPGALADAMMIFKRKGLNLTWIESFPKIGSPNEYLFFVELGGHQSDLRVRKALGLLEKKTVNLEILGSYPNATTIK